MKHKYVTTQVLLACHHNESDKVKDIHAEVQEAIAERKIAIEEWENSFSSNTRKIKKDIHTQLKETINRHKRLMKQYDWLVNPKKVKK